MKMILISFTVLMTAAAITAASANTVAIYDQAFLEQTDSGKVLHLKGEPYRMGYQYGVLLGDEIDLLLKILVEQAMKQYNLPPELIDIIKDLAFSQYAPFIPEEIMTEFQGMIDGAGSLGIDGFTIRDLVVANSLIDFIAVLDLNGLNCSGMAAWGNRTIDGKVFSSRNIDLFIGYGIDKYPLISVIKQDSKVPVANLGYVSFLGCVSGLNANGISMAQVWAKSVDKNPGLPWPLMVRQILQSASDVSQAVDMFTADPGRTYGSNFVFSGGKGELKGVTIETTAHLSAWFHDNDDREDAAMYNDICYAIKMPEAVFRAATAFDPNIRALQTCDNGPDGDPRTSGSYTNRYSGQALRILDYGNQGVLIGHEQVETISRAVAMRGDSLQCVVYANDDLEAWVANTWTDDQGVAHDACEGEYRYFNFRKSVPSVDVVLNQSRYRPGDQLEISVRTSTYGPDAPLDLYFFIEADGKYFFYPDFSENVQSVAVTVSNNQSPAPVISLSAALQFDVPTGSYVCYSVLVEPNSGDLIDISRAGFEFWK